MGTSEYLSPEILIEEKCGPPADIWAFGCIIYKLFIGYTPFKDMTDYLTF